MTELFCYECQHNHPVNDMQDYDCIICGGRKCKKLHGGEGNHSCETCLMENLCIDCKMFGKCCQFPCCGEFHSKNITICPTCKTPWELELGGIGWNCEPYQK